MPLSEKIVTAAVMALFLAVWQLYGLTAYTDLLATKGLTLGVGELALGYFTILASAYVVIFVIMRKIRTRSGK